MEALPKALCSRVHLYEAMPELFLKWRYKWLNYPREFRLMRINVKLKLLAYIFQESHNSQLSCLEYLRAHEKRCRHSDSRGRYQSNISSV